MTEPDWDWNAYYDKITSLATTAFILDTYDMSPSTRTITLERLERDTTEAAHIAAFLAARSREGVEPK
ncbi:hypothetical protein [Streptomyces sp. NRRL F-5135]|uniref:hypothetical protein n=1 Tax=Streptomyces sp. NRRL F-5135 TaxID=1463858 RepID=UPI0004CC5798|nr:hypothetical protein [Streptomyces sp. NRRL F-5135]